MKLQVLVFVFFLVLSQTLPTRNIDSVDQKKWNKLKNGSTWAKVILNFAELENMSGGPLEDLAKAIQDLVVDLENKITRATAEFQDRTDEHNSEVSRLNDDIDSANLDISETSEFLETVLYVQRQELEMTIANLDQNIENTQKYIEEETVLRKQEHKQFQERLAEHQDAVAAVDECVAILRQLEEQGGEFALAQVNVAQNQIERLQQKLGKNADGALVQALMELANSQFTNQADLSNVLQLLQQVKNNLIASIAKEVEDEDQSQSDFETEMKNKRAQINTWILEKTDAQAQLARNAEQIQSNEQFVVERQGDLAEAQADLDAENESYALAEQHYNDLVEQLNSEKSACNEALVLLENAGFAGYIGERVAQGHDQVVDQAHGSGINVFDF